MFIFIALLIPVLTSIVLVAFFNHKVVWWEFLIPFAVSIILVSIFKVVAVHGMTRDVEYWNGYGIEATYYEDWNEKVSCRHPEYCTRTVTKTRSDGKGGTQTYTTTERYQCGYQHPYDVDYHPPHWELSGSNGENIGISQDFYVQLTKRWNNETFVDLHRNYHTDDGDKYVTAWDRRDETIEIINSIHTYENKVQASDSIMNFPEITEEEIERYDLYGYPNLQGHYIPSVLGMGYNSDEGKRYLDIWNAKIGAQKQVRMWILVFKDQTMEAAIKQRDYWKNGNKNEVVACIGIDKENNMTWAYVFSWTDRKTFVATLQSDLSAMKKPDILEAAKLVVKHTQKDFKRKEFSDFDYIKVRPSGWSVFWTFLITSLVNIGLSFYLVMNQIDENWRGKSIKRNLSSVRGRISERTFNEKWAAYKKRRARR